LQLGVVYDFRNPPSSGISTADFYAECLDHAAQVEALGFDTVWLSEHHFVEDSYLPSLMVMAAAMAIRTKRVTIGTELLLLPLHHPLHVAEDAAVVDNLSGGRLRLGVALGYKLDEFAAFGVDRRHRPSLLEEGVAVIRGAWADEPFNFAGRHFTIEGVSVTPKPVQPPGPEIWIGARAEKPARRAGRIGDGGLIGGRPNLAPLQEAWQEAGKPGRAPAENLVLRYAADDPDSAAERFREGIGHRFGQYAQWYGEAGDLERDRTALARAANGGADDTNTARQSFCTAREMISDLEGMTAAGWTSASWFATIPGHHPADTLPLFETLAAEVAPAVRSSSPSAPSLPGNTASSAATAPGR
jgi:alkanesulfonate monooxygenase SsuD/methylene tetrahydromethanopterin reductase-like flavin-dependent oxidoreductase (luciferase family)